MSEPINDGGPAFPCIYYSDPIGSIGPQLTIKGGMTLRDYFAAAAMQGIISDASVTASSKNDGELVASSAYAFADAMLKARGGVK
jgi:hypothetical protein